MSKKDTTLERNGGISFLFFFFFLGALRGVCLSGGPFYLVKMGVYLIKIGVCILRGLLGVNN